MYDKVNKFAFIICIVAFGVHCLVPEVNLPLGNVKGYLTKTWSGKEYSAFEGIPYAEPPIGKLRFEEPKPIEPWHSTLEAKIAYKCMQYSYSSKENENPVVGTEDCLYINVYTSEINPENLQPVIVHIHGGAFMYNYGTRYGPNIILDRDVVFVSFNYRVGILGFLSTEDAVLPGNLGLKDQVLALKWIQQFVNYFGGNPNSITLTGLSAGAASAQLHALSPLSLGLFHRGVSQSGTPLNPWVMVEQSLEKSKRVATHLNCSISSNRALLDCLKTKPAEDIVKCVKLFQPWMHNPFSPFGVVVDNWSKNSFLPEHPYALLKKELVQDLPWLFSNVECEGLYPAADFVSNSKNLDVINNRWNELMLHILDFNYTLKLQDRNVTLQKIKEFYLGNMSVSESTFSSLVQMMSDRLFTSDIERAARLHSAAIPSSVYYYTFHYRGAYSKSEVRSHSKTNYGVAHGDDVIYMLSTDINTHSTETDRKMSITLVDMLINFANASVPKIKQVNWLPVSKNEEDELHFLEIKSPTRYEMTSAKFLGNRHFWDSLPINENVKERPSKSEL